MRHIYKLIATMTAALLMVVIVSGCSAATGPSTVRVGTMPTEDILPLWVAEAEDLFAPNNVDVEIVPFDSAQTLSAAITAGEVDMAMTDIMRAVKLCEAGAPVEMEWITLGATPEQGRFGIMVNADSPYTTLSELADLGEKLHGAENDNGLGVAANTVPEYVFDKLCDREDVDPRSITTVEVASLPERYSLMAQGALTAAALPGSLLTLGEANGMRVIADDAEGENLSQSIMAARTAWAKKNTAAIEAVARAWDAAVALINEDPSAYRDLLVEKANINDIVADTYPVSSYPTAFATDGTALVRVPANLVEPVVAWMQQKGYTESTVAYDEETGAFTLS